MRSLLSIALVTCILGYGAAIRTDLGTQALKTTVSLQAEKKNNGYGNFVRDWVAAHHKWGRGVPVHIAGLFSLSDSDGRVDVEPVGSDDLYIAEVGIGNPPQKLKLALDTGSSDLWVQSTDTEYRVNLNGPWAPQYDPVASQTAHLFKYADWTVEYLDGTTADGVVYNDTVHLGDLTINNAPIQTAEKIASRFETETELTGIMGLAKNLRNGIEPPTISFMELLRPHLHKPVFTVDLRRNASSRFDFGHIHDDLGSEPMTWVNTTADSPHWDVEFSLTSWSAKKSPATWLSHKFQATIDTGTTLMFLPDRLAQMYWSDVEGMRIDKRTASAYSFPCKREDDLPDLKFKLPGSGHVLTIPGPYLNYGPTDDDPSYCWGGMQSADGLDVTVLGDVMLKALFVGFDLEKNQVGFANKELPDLK